MAKDMTTYPVSKGDSDKFFGYADATQIARSKGRLKLFDADAAEKLRVEQAIAAEEAKIAKSDEAVKKTQEAGGADAKTVRKAPAAK